MYYTNDCGSKSIFDAVRDYRLLSIRRAPARINANYITKNINNVLHRSLEYFEDFVLFNRQIHHEKKFTYSFNLIYFIFILRLQ